jgi:hypothetical protein
MGRLEKFATCAAACAFVGIDEPNRTKLGGWVRSDAQDCGKHGRLDGAVYFFPQGNGGMAVNNRRPDNDPAKKALFYYDYGQPGKKLTARELAERRRREQLAAWNYQLETARQIKAVSWIAQRLAKIAYAPDRWAHSYLTNKRVADVPGAPKGVIFRKDLQAVLNSLPFDVKGAIYMSDELDENKCPHLPLAAEHSYLFVPLMGASSPLPMSAQLISDRADLPRNKAFLKGTKKFFDCVGQRVGLLWAPHDLPFSCSDSLEIGLAEGLATALSARRLRGYPVCAGLDCGNLKYAARTLRSRYPNARIHLLADRDTNGAGKAGAMEALEALAAGRLTPNADMEICPAADPATLARFREWKGCETATITDFNDYEIAKGL